MSICSFFIIDNFISQPEIGKFVGEMLSQTPKGATFSDYGSTLQKLLEYTATPDRLEKEKQAKAKEFFTGMLFMPPEGARIMLGPLRRLKFATHDVLYESRKLTDRIAEQPFEIDQPLTIDSMAESGCSAVR